MQHSFKTEDDKRILLLTFAPEDAKWQEAAAEYERLVIEPYRELLMHKENDSIEGILACIRYDLLTCRGIQDFEQMLLNKGFYSNGSSHDISSYIEESQAIIELQRSGSFPGYKVDFTLSLAAREGKGLTPSSQEP
ncbi:hypothetical protein JXB11_02515 [Candidatus Woesearchaeota archaeon]|nr:hypothetical protein [Candidatus Woesearchaeota archaeon]